MQALRGWTPPTGVLASLVESARARVEDLRARAGELERAAAEAAAPPPFAAALRGTDVRLICEIKRRSPSKGEIGGALDLPSFARGYAAGGAAALSILTEPTRFGGSAADLRGARAAVPLPLLKKDFNVDELQLVEGRADGASAVLLIARALPPKRLRELAGFARGLGLEPLVEIRDDAELDAALDAAAEVIGVNTRNLETLAIDPAVADTLIPRIPAACVAVFESGIAGRADVERAARTGADAVLVGSSLSAAADPAVAVAAIAGVATVPHAARR